MGRRNRKNWPLVWGKENRELKYYQCLLLVRGKLFSWIIAELFKSQYYFKIYSCCLDNSAQYTYVRTAFYKGSSF